MQTSKVSARAQFQFSNPQAQAAEARLNAAEARALLERHVPLHLRESAEDQSESTSAAGQCFRNVQAILAGKGRK